MTCDVCDLYKSVLRKFIKQIRTKPRLEEQLKLELKDLKSKNEKLLVKRNIIESNSRKEMKSLENELQR